MWTKCQKFHLRQRPHRERERESWSNKNWKWQIALGGSFLEGFCFIFISVFVFGRRQRAGCVDRKHDTEWATNFGPSSVIHLWRQQQQCRTYSKSNSRLKRANNTARTGRASPKTTRTHRKIQNEIPVGNQTEQTDSERANPFKPIS